MKWLKSILLIAGFLIIAGGIYYVLQDHVNRNQEPVEHQSIEIIDHIDNSPTRTEPIQHPELEINRCDDWNLLDAANIIDNLIVDEQTGRATQKDGMVLIPMVPVEQKDVALHSDGDMKLIYYDQNQKMLRAEMIGATGGYYFSLPEACSYISVMMQKEHLEGSFLVANDWNQAKIVTSEKFGYSSVKAAVDQTEQKGVIIVFPGVYSGTVKCWGKEISLIGTDKEECIITSSASSYYAPPIEMSAGALEHLTIRATGAHSTESPGAYAVHVEDHKLYGKELTISDCILTSTSNSALGMGMRGGCNIRIIDSQLTGYEFGIFCHDSAYANYSGEQNLSLIRCEVEGKNGSYAIRFDSQGVKDAKVNVTFIDTVLKNSNNKNTDSLISARNNAGHGTKENWLELKNYYLMPESSGNNVSVMNH